MTLRDQLIRDEGCRLRVYDDTRGIPTIGVGRNLRDKGISQSEADLLLDHDLSESAAAVSLNLPWTDHLDEPRRAVFINMTFNLGMAGLLKFTRTLALAERGEYDEAAQEMLRSKWARQVGLRATRLSEQLRTGEWV